MSHRPERRPDSVRDRPPRNLYEAVLADLRPLVGKPVFDVGEGNFVVSEGSVFALRIRRMPWSPDGGERLLFETSALDSRRLDALGGRARMERKPCDYVAVSLIPHPLVHATLVWAIPNERMIAFKTDRGFRIVATADDRHHLHPNGGGPSHDVTRFHLRPQGIQAMTMVLMQEMQLHPSLRTQATGPSATFVVTLRPVAGMSPGFVVAAAAACGHDQTGVRDIVEKLNAGREATLASGPGEICHAIVGRLKRCWKTHHGEDGPEDSAGWFDIRAS